MKNNEGERDADVWCRYEDIIDKLDSNEDITDKNDAIIYHSSDEKNRNEQYILFQFPISNKLPPQSQNWRTCHILG